MSRFSDVIYDSEAQTVVIGAGLVWDDVYAALEPHGVNVVGGRISGVGVAGLTLGGGASEARVRTMGLDMIDRVLVAYKPVWSDNRYCAIV